MRPIIVVLAVPTLAVLVAINTVYTKRTSNYIREGPGSYYNLIAVVPANTALVVLEKSGGWLKVNLPGSKPGWLAGSSLSGAKPAEVVGIENVWSSPKASKAGIVAAIRGFAERYGKTEPGSVESLLQLSRKTFTDREFAEFKRELDPYRPREGSRVKWEEIDLRDVVYDAGLPEQQIGAGIAARLVHKGVEDSPAVLAYLNMVCAVVAEQSGLYDWDFTVMLLRDGKVNGFAVPGGYILLTRGAVGLCSNESELAAIIAHEMAHIVRRHGLQEMTQRLAAIHADAAFAELEEETGNITKDEEELGDLVEATHEKISAPKLATYELEADLLAAILCANAGYDPFGLVHLIARLAKLPRERPDIFDPMYMAPDVLADRQKVIRGFVERELGGVWRGAQLRERFARRFP